MAEERSLRTREILTLFLPLAATSTMMATSVPIINAGLARTADPERNLAAFGLAFTLGIFLESPVFALQQAALAWYSGRGPSAHIIRFALGVGLVVTAYESLVVFGPLGRFALEHLMAAEPELAGPALGALRVAVVFPLLISVRSALQGVLIARRRSGAVGWGTLFRLLTLGGVVGLVVPRLPWEPPVASMVALAAAVLVESIYVAWLVRSTPEVDGRTSPAQEAGRTAWGKLVFILPLMGMMLLGTLTNPVINAFLTRTPNPEFSLAAYAVITSLVWFLASPFLRFSSVTIALGSSSENIRLLGRFVWKGVGVLCAGLFILQFTPLFGLILRGVMGLGPGLVDAVRPALLLLCLQPLVAAFIAHNQGVLTRGARTWLVGWGGLGRMAGILIVGFVGLGQGIEGGFLGGVLLGVAFLAELIVVSGMRFLTERPRLRPEAGFGAGQQA